MSREDRFFERRVPTNAAPQRQESLGPLRILDPQARESYRVAPAGQRALARKTLRRGSSRRDVVVAQLVGVRRPWLIGGAALLGFAFLVGCFSLLARSRRPTSDLNATAAADTAEDASPRHVHTDEAPPTISSPTAAKPQTPPTSNLAPPNPAAPANPSSAPANPSSPLTNPSSPPAANEPAAPEVQYRWAAGKDYRYSVKVVAKAGERELTFEGDSLYAAVAPRPAGAAAKREPQAEASGTGFVIDPAGVLLTCAHVVRNATQIEVKLGGKTYPGRVLATDSANDLALVRIDATGLPSLSLGDSDRVELSQEVRAFGFPLSDVLGSSIKVTSGAIAGIIDRQGQKLLQVDASINPGNSGGPVVNKNGEVVGVACAKLSGVEIDRVGFAVPINTAKQLLTRHKVQIASRAATPLDGPELARRTTPAVAFLEVKLGNSKQTLAFRGHYRRRTSGGGLPVGVADVPVASQGRLTVDDLGEVQNSDVKESLPYVLGRVCDLVFVPLPGPGERTWQSRRAIFISIRKEPDRSDPFSCLGPLSPFGRPPIPGGPKARPGMPRSPFDQPEPNVEVVPAFEQAKYEFAKTDDGSVTIKKKYELATLGAASKTSIASRGEGTIVFDTKEGVPTSMELTSTFTIEPAGQAAQEVPLTVSFRRESIVAGNGGLALPNQPVNPPRPAVPVDLDALLKKLRDPATTPTELTQGFAQLAQAPVVENRRDEVAEVLEKFLSGADAQRKSALIAVPQWAGTRNVSTLLKLLDQVEASFHAGIFLALGRIGDERAIEPLAKRLENSTDRFAARVALVKFGAKAEAAIVPLLRHSVAQVRAEACRIAGSIRAASAEATLKELAETDSDNTVRTAARLAYRSITGNTLPRTTAPNPGGKTTGGASPSKNPAGSAKADDAKVGELLGKLKGNFNERVAALSELERTTPSDSRRGEVLKAAKELLEGKDALPATCAINVIGAWGTKDDVSVLTDVVANRADQRIFASLALQKMGSMAEDDVLALLDNADKIVRRTACDILAKVGGEKSLAALKKLESDAELKVFAQLAVRTIERRGK